MSTKGAGDENFPVASRFLSAWARPHVMAFYMFARAADDVADAAHLRGDEKREALLSMRAQLARGAPKPNPTVYALHQSLLETSVTQAHAQDLLEAFIRDTQTPRTADWGDLMAYCDLSAAPVGRYLIDLLGGGRGAYLAASDALCAALQILNHIQDVKDDFQSLDRVYVPADWMVEAGVVDQDLAASQASPALRRILDRMLDCVDALLVQAKPLPGAIRSRALAREAGGILSIAMALSKHLRVHDPIAGRVALSKVKAVTYFLWGVLKA